MFRPYPQALRERILKAPESTPQSFTCDLLLRDHINVLLLCLPSRTIVMQKFLYNEFRLTDKTMKLNVNVVLGFQNVIAILISFVSKKSNDD